MVGNKSIWGMGTLSASVLSKDALARMYQSSYSTGNSASTTNYLGMMKDLLDAGGTSVFTMNNQALAKQLRNNMDAVSVANNDKKGVKTVDKFGAYVQPDFSTIYKPYDSGSTYDIPSDVSVSKDEKNKSVVIGINVAGNNENSGDAKQTAVEVARLFEQKGYSAKIQEMDGKIETLADFLHNLAKDVSNSKIQQYG
jgi:hypothetical protein